jgi:two-component system cell cycle response regulator
MQPIRQRFSSEHETTGSGLRPDRAKAAEDRARAAADREEAARERAEALQQRTEAAHDLEAATIDELTGAWTRRLGLEEVSRELARARRTGTSFVLAFLDVDGLKQINDSEGHLAGDAVLQLVGETLRAKVRAYDVTVRYGGDELICAMSNISPSEVRARFERVSTALAAASPKYSITVGLAEFEPADNLQDLLARADADLLQARTARTGRR